MEENNMFNTGNNEYVQLVANIKEKGIDADKAFESIKSQLGM